MHTTPKVEKWGSRLMRFVRPDSEDFADTLARKLTESELRQLEAEFEFAEEYARDRLLIRLDSLSTQKDKVAAIAKLAAEANARDKGRSTYPPPNPVDVAILGGDPSL